jgi:uncharacterized protein (TIGR04255 family)
MVELDFGFPEQPRLNNLPLRIALCQVRFQRLFGLSGAEVRPLARALHAEYPKATDDQVQTVQFGLSPEGVLAPAEGQTMTAYRFTSADGRWRATLTQEWLSLESEGYAGFKDFAARWHLVLSETRKVLDIPEETRLGLRYVNEIAVGEDSSPKRLRSLLSAEVLGPLQLDPDAEALLRSWQEIRFKHGEGGCTMQHGYVQNTKQEWVYVLDFDGFREGTREIDEMEQLQALADLNHRIFSLFQSSVTPEAFESFEPQEQTA